MDAGVDEAGFGILAKCGEFDDFVWVLLEVVEVDTRYASTDSRRDVLYAVRNKILNLKQPIRLFLVRLVNVKSPLNHNLQGELAVIRRFDLDYIPSDFRTDVHEEGFFQIAS